jgi:hypothetical protein
MMNEEAKKLRSLNHSLKLAKASADEEYLAEEDSLRIAEQSLRNQLKEESHTKIILQVNYIVHRKRRFQNHTLDGKNGF